MMENHCSSFLMDFVMTRGYYYTLIKLKRLCIFLSAFMRQKDVKTLYYIFGINIVFKLFSAVFNCLVKLVSVMFLYLCTIYALQFILSSIMDIVWGVGCFTFPSLPFACFHFLLPPSHPKCSWLIPWGFFKFG